MQNILLPKRILLNFYSEFFFARMIFTRSMRWLVIIILFLISNHYAHAQAMNDLTEYRWKNRLVLLFSSQEDDSLVQRQRNLLGADQSGLEERDLLIFRVLPNQVLKEGDSVKTDSAGKDLAKRLRKRYQVNREEFIMILIGKDGSEKLRSDTLVPLEELYALIDAMPMRREEMRKKN